MFDDGAARAAKSCFVSPPIGHMALRTIGANVWRNKLAVGYSYGSVPDPNN